MEVAGSVGAVVAVPLFDSPAAGCPLSVVLSVVLVELVLLLSRDQYCMWGGSA